MMGWRPAHNTVMCCTAGVMFFTAWWMLLDLLCVHGEYMSRNRMYHLGGVMGTLSLFMVNSIRSMDPSAWGAWDAWGSGGAFKEDGCCLGTRCGLLYLFLGFAIGFGGVIYGTFILIADFLLEPANPIYVGVVVWLHNALILAANMVLRFGRHVDMY